MTEPLRPGIALGHREAPTLWYKRESEMYARMGTLYPRSGNFEHVLRLLRDTVTPAAQREPGFRGMLIMKDRQAGKVISVILWESETDMLASERGEYLQEQVSRIIAYLRKPPELEDYEIEVL